MLYFLMKGKENMRQQVGDLGGGGRCKGLLIPSTHFYNFAVYVLKFYLLTCCATTQLVGPWFPKQGLNLGHGSESLES